jgi:hypothetical protein
MRGRAKRRDECEVAIVLALRAAGCAVQPLNDDGVPDLLVSRGGRLELLECKDVRTGHGHVRAMRGKHDDPDPRYRELTPVQVAWWRRWEAACGRPPVIVHDVDEALAAMLSPIATGLPADLVPDAVAVAIGRKLRY